MTAARVDAEVGHMLAQGWGTDKGPVRFNARERPPCQSASSALELTYMGPRGQAAWIGRRPPMTLDQADRRSQSPLLEPMLLQAACKLRLQDAS